MTTATATQGYTMAQYLEALQAHDWWYDYADDHTAWRRGRDQERELHAMAAQLDPDKAIYRDHIPASLR